MCQRKHVWSACGGSSKEVSKDDENDLVLEDNNRVKT